MYIEKPSNPEAHLTFSTYKNTNTQKTLAGITPSGSVCFISNKERKQYIWFYWQIKQGDEVMAGLIFKKY